LPASTTGNENRQNENRHPALKSFGVQSGSLSFAVNAHTRWRGSFDAMKTRQRLRRNPAFLAFGIVVLYSFCVSTAELIYAKAKALPEPAQLSILEMVELMSNQASPEPSSPIKPGSAKGLITMTEDFDVPMDDFKPYME
jgi:hypothetical protein